MPNNQFNDRQKRIIRAFSKGLRDKPGETKWSYQSIPGDDNAFDLAVDINSGIPAGDDLTRTYISPL